MATGGTMKILVFEDEHVADLYPLVYLRPVFELRCGARSLLEKVRHAFAGHTVYLETRDELDAVASERHGADVVNSHQAAQPDADLLLVNAAAILTSEPASYGEREMVGCTEDGRFIWAFLKAETVKRLGAPAGIGLAQMAAEELPREVVDDVLVRYPWDLVNHNPAQIEADFGNFYTPQRKSEPLRGAAMIGPAENLYIGRDVELQPHTWLDCREGPVIVEDGALISAHTSIKGPAFIGEGTRLYEARVRGGCSFGPQCRVGGEVEQSIIHACSNKYHVGFLGHSYVGEWVNLGALTTNSDLKNDYTAVKVRLADREVDTGLLKLGAFIGDHTKTSIGTLLNTGSVIGIMCNLVAGSSVLPKHIPSFCWYFRDRISKGMGVEYAISTARAAMARRGVELTEAMVELIHHAEQMTAEQKREAVRRDRRKSR